MFSKCLLLLVTWIAVGGLMCAFGATVRAQPLHSTIETLEWMAADSPVIVRGTIMDFARDEQVEEQTGVTRVMDTIVLRVIETLKGDDRPFAIFTVRGVMDEDDVQRWKQAEADLLVLLIESDKATWYFLSDREETQIRRYALTPRYTGEQFAIFELTDREQTSDLPDVLTLTDQIRGDRKRLLQSTRDAIEAAGEVRHLQRHPVRGFRDASIIDRVVPVDHRLEAVAREWVRSEDSFIRQEGAKALQYFPSDENILVLKSLLKDPAWSMLHKHVGEERITLGREYYVRKAAFESLKAMGVDVEQPVLLETVSDGSN